jgi:N-acetylmuramoyl-L-alanine amidase
MTAPFGIVLHHTAGRFPTDLATLTKPNQGTGGKSVSSNDYVTKTGVIYQIVPFPRCAWHAGGARLVTTSMTGTRTGGASRSRISATATTRTRARRSSRSYGAVASGVAHSELATVPLSFATATSRPAIPTRRTTFRGPR